MDSAKDQLRDSLMEAARSEPTRIFVRCTACRRIRLCDVVAGEATLCDSCRKGTT